MSNFSFSHSVFKRLVLQTHKDQGLFRKELSHKLSLPANLSETTFFCETTPWFFPQNCLKISNKTHKSMYTNFTKHILWQMDLALDVKKIQVYQKIHVFMSLKVALQILGRKFYKNTKKSSLYSQSLLIFIHKTPVVERHPITREIRDLLWPRSTQMGNTVYFYMSNI